MQFEVMGTRGQTCTLVAKLFFFPLQSFRSIGAEQEGQWNILCVDSATCRCRKGVILSVFTLWRAPQVQPFTSEDPVEEIGLVAGY